ncbi:hypothetical protein F511_07477 [Dorcoceras hygrometricum]|uniref:Uncharacterized protein n=1 Tax=Dorcoceras hygrometricum TaxID=472368 RepID=A0A2Z7DDH4_9LAMI|nr:hypothetical protein F511_07477 [Dorcoceras hygrometricum]
MCPSRVCVSCRKQGAKRYRLGASQIWRCKRMLRRIAYSDLMSKNEICLAGVSRCEFLLEEVSVGQCFETGVVGFEEHVVCLRDCGPVVLLFFNSFGFELVVASAELAVELLGQ